MIKRFFIPIGMAALLLLCQSAIAGDFFKVTGSGIQVAPYKITLCLNANGPISCQTYTVSALDLSIQTTIPNHVYPFAGIKNNIAGYTVLNCTTPSNGFCLFSVSSNTTSSLSTYPLNRVVGTISGLTASGLVLQNNGGDNLTIQANATSFVFTQPITKGDSYSVSVLTQPTREFCNVINGTGDNTNGTINNVSIVCTPVPVAYMTSASGTPGDYVIDSCPLIASKDSTNGTIDTDKCTSTTPLSQGRIYGLSFAVIGTEQYAYLVNNAQLSINICNITPSTAALTGNCPSAITFQDPPTGNFYPTGVTVATVGEAQYVYVSTNVNNKVFSCTIQDSAGNLYCGEYGASGPPSTPIPTPIPENEDPNNPRFWSPWSTAFTNVNSTQYGYVVAPFADNEVYLCPLTIPYNGTLSSCVDSAAHLLSPPSWTPTAIAFAAVNNTPYAYIVSKLDQHSIWRCSIGDDGYFEACTLDYNFQTSGGNILGISIATVNGILYAYVSNPSSVSPAVYQCPINTTSGGNGQIESCRSIYPLPSAKPYTSITMQVIQSG